MNYKQYIFKQIIFGALFTASVGALILVALSPSPDTKQIPTHKLNFSASSTVDYVISGEVEEVCRKMGGSWRYIKNDFRILCVNSGSTTIAEFGIGNLPVNN